MTQRLIHAAIAALICLAALAARADDPPERAFFDKFQLHLAGQIEAARIAELAPASFRQADELLSLDAAGLKLTESPPRWTIAPRRPLTAAERQQALAGAEEFLQWAFASARAYAELAAEAKKPVAQCAICLTTAARDRSPLDLSNNGYEVKSAIDNYLYEQWVKKRFHQPEFAALNAYVGGPDKGREIEIGPSGSIDVAVPLTNRYYNDFRNRFLQAERSGRVVDPNLTAGAGFLPAAATEPLVQVVREALYRRPLAEGKPPALSEAEAARVQINVMPGVRVMVALSGESGFGGGGGTIETLVRHSLRRTVESFLTVTAPSALGDRTAPQFVARLPEKRLTLTLRNERTYGPTFGDRPTLWPKLVLDPPGFTGATISAMAFSPDGQRLAAAGDVLRIWSLATGKLEETVRVKPANSGGSLTDVAWTPDGKYLAVSVSGTLGTVRIYEVGNVRRLFDVLAGHEGFVDRLAFSPDGKWLLTAGSDKRAYLWDWNKRQKVRALVFQQRLDVATFPDPDRATALLMNATGSVTLAQAETLDFITEPQAASAEIGRLAEGLAWPGGGQAHPYSVSVRTKSRRLAVAGHSETDGQDRFWCGVWGFDDAEPSRVFDLPARVTATALSSAGDLLAIADATGTIRVVDPQTGETQHTFRGGGIIGPAIQWDGNTLSQARAPQAPAGDDPAAPTPRTLKFNCENRQLEFTDEPIESTPITRQAGLQLSLLQASPPQAPDPRVIVQNAQRQTAVLPLGDPARWEITWLSFLRSGLTGTPNPVLLGQENGELQLYDSRTMQLRRNFVGHTDKILAAAESADGRVLVTTSADGTVRWWPLEEIKSWPNLAALVDDSGTVAHVVPNSPTARAGIKPGDRIEYIGEYGLDTLQTKAARGEWPFQPGETVAVKVEGWDQSRNIQLSPSADSVRPLVSFFATESGEWVFWTPEGYYDSSPAMERWIGFEQNVGGFAPAQFVPVAQFRQRLRRPDVIDAVIRTGQRPQPEPPPAPAQGAALTPDEQPEQPDLFDVVTGLPQVEILEPAATMRTGSAEVYVRAAIRMSRRDVQLFGRPEVSVLVNGVPAPQPRGAVMVQEDATETAPVYDFEQSGTYEYVRKLRWPVQLLDSGANTIAVVATNKAVQNDAARTSVEVIYRRQQAAKPALHVLSIGVSDYLDDGITDLHYARADAEDFAAAMERFGGPLHGRFEKTVLTNKTATTAAISDALPRLATDTRPGSTVVIFVAAHGLLDGQGDYYLMTHDTDRSKLGSTAVAFGRFRDAIQNLPGRRVLFFADTCHSAALDQAIDQDYVNVRSLAGDEMGVFVFASCRARQRSYEPQQLQHGLFTKAILSTLAQDGGNSDRSSPPDGKLSLKEFEFVLAERMAALHKDCKMTEPQDLNFMQSRMSGDFQVFELSPPAANN